MAYIKLDRKFFEGKFWTQKRTFSQAEAWIDLVQSARFEMDTETKLLDNGRLINVERGEIHASLRYLAERWGWGIEKVKRFIDMSTKEQALKRRIEQGESIITLLNYDTYNPISNTDQYTDRTVKKVKSEPFNKKTERKIEHQTEQQNSDITSNKTTYYEQLENANRTPNRTANRTPTNTPTSTPTEQTKEGKESKNNIYNNSEKEKITLAEKKEGKKRNSSVAKAPGTLHTICKEVFHEKFRQLFGEEYYWEAKDGANLNGILKKIKHNREMKNLPNDDQSVNEAFKYFLDSISDDWILKNFSITNINSKFNEIVSQAKQNGSRKQKAATTDDELIANVYAGIKRGIKENSIE